MTKRMVAIACFTLGLFFMWLVNVYSIPRISDVTVAKEVLQ